MKSKIILVITFASTLFAHPMLAMNELQIEFRGKKHTLSEQTIEQVGFLDLREFADNHKFTDEHKVFKLDTLLNATRPGTTEDEFTKHIELTKQGAKIIDFMIKGSEGDDNEDDEIWSLNFDYKHLIRQLQAKELLTGDDDDDDDEEVEKDKIYKIMRDFICDLKQFNLKKLIAHTQLADVLNNKALLPFFEVQLKKIIEKKGKEYCLHGTGCLKNIFEELPNAVFRQMLNQMANQTLPVKTFIGHKDDVGSIIKINDDQVISASSDSTLKLWSLKTGNCLKTFRGHEHGVSSIAKINEYQIMSSSWGTMKLWDLNTAECLETYEKNYERFKKHFGNNHDYKIEGFLKLSELATGNLFQIFIEDKNEPLLKSDKIKTINDHQIIARDGKTLKLLDLHWFKQLPLEQVLFLKTLKPNEKLCLAFYPHAYKTFCQLPKDKQEWALKNNLVYRKKLCLLPYSHAYKTFYQLSKDKQEWALKKNLVHIPVITKMWRFIKSKLAHSPVVTKTWQFIKNNLVHSPIPGKLWGFAKNHRKKIVGTGLGLTGTFGLLTASILLKKSNTNKEIAGLELITPQLKYLVTSIKHYDKRPCLS